jgi:hypothetical protein
VFPGKGDGAVDDALAKCYKSNPVENPLIQE